ATKHRERAAYQWSVEVSAYVRDGCRGSGIGAALYTSLFELLRLQGFCNAYAGITLPNPASVALHSRLGFTTIGVFGKIGFKAGAWHDVLWMHREVAPRDADPEAPTPLPVLLERVDCGPALEKGLSLLRGRSAGRAGPSDRGPCPPWWGRSRSCRTVVRPPRLRIRDGVLRCRTRGEPRAWSHHAPERVDSALPEAAQQHRSGQFPRN